MKGFEDIGHVRRFGHRAFCECNFEEQFSCCMVLPGFLVDFFCSLERVFLDDGAWER